MHFFLHTTVRCYHGLTEEAFMTEFAGDFLWWHIDCAGLLNGL